MPYLQLMIQKPFNIACSPPYSFIVNYHDFGQYHGLGVQDSSRCAIEHTIFCHDVSRDKKGVTRNVENRTNTFLHLPCNNYFRSTHMLTTPITTLMINFILLYLPFTLKIKLDQHLLFDSFRNGKVGNRNHVCVL